MDKFSINSKNQLRSIRGGIYFSLILLPMGILSVLLKDPSLFIFCLIFVGLFLLPAIYLHFSYFIFNFRTVLNLDSNSRKIIISRKGSEYIYSFDEIAYVEQNIGVYYKNKIDGGSRKRPAWTNYGYIKLGFKEGRSFIFTSLLIDPLKFPFLITNVNYRFLPFLGKEDETFEYRQIDVINKFKILYAKFSKEELLERINNPAKFTPEIVMASKELYESKFAKGV